MKFLVKPLNDKARELYSNHTTYFEGDSGLDLFIVEDCEILPGQTKLIGSGVSCQLEENGKYYSYNLYARSSISKTPLRLANGVGLIDRTYTGELKAALHNTGDTSFFLKTGDRYTQISRADLGEISFEIVEELRETKRGSGGFGSTNAPKN
jgi:dUTP pyrophosphatase